MYVRFMLSKGTAEVLEQVLETESRCSDNDESDSDDDESDSDNDSVFHPSDVSDDDDDDGDDGNDILWEAEAKNSTGSKIFLLFYALLVTAWVGCHLSSS